MNATIQQEEQEARQEIDAKLAEIRAMDVQWSIGTNTSELFSLMEILERLAEKGDEGDIARIEQYRRVVVFKRTGGDWHEVAQCPTIYPKWSETKGWND